MARKTEVVTIEREGRDAGKSFLLREMPASQAERWATRAFLALARGGVELPDDVTASGMAGIAAIGLKALANVTFADAQLLLDEMFQCVSFMPDSSKPNVVRALIEDDIEEVATRLQLRQAVFELHTGFFAFAARSKAEADAATLAST